MPRFGWTSLAYLLFVLTVLAALVRLGSPAAETRPLAAEIPQDTTADGSTVNNGMPSAAAAGTRETMGMAQRIDGAISSLVDVRGTVGAAEARSPRSRAPGSPAARSPRPGTSDPPAPEIALPVFYRPSPGEALSGGAAGPVCGDLERFPKSSRVVFPLQRRHFYSYEDTWGAPRTQGGHEGTDLMAPSGAPEYAVTDGTVVPVAGSNENGWNTLGGYAVMIRADYSIGPVEEGDLFYYAHLQRRSDLKPGTRVRAGQVIGHAGDTGQGPEVTSGLFPPHLHLGWYDSSWTRSAVESGAMNPYPLLEWIKANGGAVTGGSDARYCEAPSPPTPVPSTGEKDWPAPAAPGVRPDLDTGSNDPKPSPVVRNEARARTGPAQEVAPAERAVPAKRPARVLRDRTLHKDRRDAPARVPEARRLRTPEPPTPGTRGPRTEKPQEPEPPRREPPRRKPSRDEIPKPPVSGGAPPAHERPSPGSTEENLGPEPADTEKRDRPGKDERDEKREKERAKERAKRDREEKPNANEPEEPQNPPAADEPAEAEPSTPEPEAEDPDGSDEPEPETPESQTTESGSETTVASEETTDG